MLSNLYPPFVVGGYERLVATVADGLSRRGHEISVLTSDYGMGERTLADPFPVERTLRLLVSQKSIYEPFGGTEGERRELSRHNARTLERAIRSRSPDAILVGNLHFLDRAFLAALDRAASRAVYLLTDIYMIHFFDDAFLQDYFRRSVLDPAPGTPRLVPPDPPPLRFEAHASESALQARLVEAGVEQLRRRRREVELAAGRRVHSLPGRCVLCGVSSFVIRRAGEATLALGPQPCAEAVCTSCGINGTGRGAIHAAMDLDGFDPNRESLWVARAASVGARLRAKFPAATVVQQLRDATRGRRFRRIGLLDPPDDAKEGSWLRELDGLLAEDGVAIVAEPPVEGDAWRLLGSAGRAGLSGEVRSFWSEAWGYLGRDHHALVLRR